MEVSGYVTLSRLSGLRREMDVVANNIANIGTQGFKGQGAQFSEFVAAVPNGRSLSMARVTAWHMDMSAGPIAATGGTFDLAIEGPGFFQIETADGPRYSRAGSFTPNAAGELVNMDGLRLLDAGGAPVFVPTDSGPIGIAVDGTLSAGGQPIGQIGLWEPVDPLTLAYAGGNLLTAGEVQPVDGGRMRQGFLEESNVQPVAEVARMIEVQRAYEQGQSFLEAEDERLRNLIQTMGR